LATKECIVSDSIFLVHSVCSYNIVLPFCCHGNVQTISF